ncbi:MAG TPA: hypothetical protein VE944_33450 [Nostoc sp.]|uniref:hypothetical protein n=1 Tax=Nostoc sp. TaxID=1180 RepID=UPI002D5E52F7|nr:hypothetical protein [Nostoc sp.]HYX19171.1 hypothetical protein [Nostoc sp.]
MGDILSLAQAAKLAGVTPVTMRKWVDEVPDVERGSKGEYRIPRESLMGYLAGKETPKVRGVSKVRPPDTTPDSRGGHMLEYLQDQLAAKDRMIDELRTDLKEAQGEVRKLEAELRAHLAGGGLGGVSRWIKSKLV